MTAQIIIGNGHAIVVASDGASTMGRRTYGSAEKLMPLPDPHRVAVLHSGSVQIHGASMPGLIDDWARSLPAVPLPSIADYRDSFSAFLQNAIQRFTNENQLLLDYLDAAYYGMKSVAETIQSAANENGLTEDLVHSVWKDHLSAMTDNGEVVTNDSWTDELLQKIQHPGDSNPVDVARRAEALSRYVKEWEVSYDGIVDNLFGKMPCNKAIEELRQTFIYNITAKMYPCPWEYDHCLYFAGYGESEVLPSYVVSSYYGYVNGRLWKADGDTQRPERIWGGHILIATIGMSNDMNRFIQDIGFELSASRDSLDQALEELVKSDGEKSLKELREKIGEEFSRHFGFKRYQNFERVRSTLSLLNPKNLVDVAEGLVRMQALAMDAGGDLPSVGSGVLSACITRADGFVWSDQMRSHLK